MYPNDKIAAAGIGHAAHTALDEPHVRDRDRVYGHYRPPHFGPTPEIRQPVDPGLLSRVTDWLAEQTR
jgi:hypothetical protein